jgi:hypothetical protein
MLSRLVLAMMSLSPRVIIAWTVMQLRFQRPVASSAARKPNTIAGASVEPEAG